MKRSTLGRSAADRPRVVRALATVEDRGRCLARADRLGGDADRAPVGQRGAGLVERRDLLVEPGLLLAAVEDRELDLAGGGRRRGPVAGLACRPLRRVLPA